VAEQGQEFGERIGHITDVVDNEDIGHLNHPDRFAYLA
jgi:hypothetical protein